MAAAGRQCILKGKKRQRQLEVIIAAIALTTTSACPLVVSTGRRRSLVLLHGGFSEFPGLPLAFVEDDGQIHVVLPHVVRSAVLHMSCFHMSCFHMFVLPHVVLPHVVPSVLEIALVGMLTRSVLGMLTGRMLTR